MGLKIKESSLSIIVKQIKDISFFIENISISYKIFILYDITTTIQKILLYIFTRNHIQKKFSKNIPI